MKFGEFKIRAIQLRFSEVIQQGMVLTDSNINELEIWRNAAAMNEHLDPNSYSWCVMRYAIVKYIRASLLNFLPQIGIELPGKNLDIHIF